MNTTACAYGCADFADNDSRCEDCQRFTTTYKGRAFTLARAPSTREKYPNAWRLSLENGWDGYSYLGTGPRGAQYLFYRSASTGAFRFVTAL